MRDKWLQVLAWYHGARGAPGPSSTNLQQHAWDAPLLLPRALVPADGDTLQVSSPKALLPMTSTAGIGTGGLQHTIPLLLLYAALLPNAVTAWETLRPQHSRYSETQSAQVEVPFVLKGSPMYFMVSSAQIQAQTSKLITLPWSSISYKFLNRRKQLILTLTV